MINKKYLSYALIFSIIIAFFITPLFANNKKLKIAIVLWRGETKAEDGFKDKLKKIGYSVQYTTINGEQDKNRLKKKIISELKPKINRFDYIYSFGTTATLLVKNQIQSKIPQIFNIVASPVKAGIVKKMDKPGSNISGVSNYISIKTQIETVLKIFKIKNIAFIYNPIEKNSKIILNRIKKVAKLLNLNIIEFKSPPPR